MTTGSHTTDLQLTPKQISNLSSADAIAAFFTSLGYDTGVRTSLTAEAIGFSGESAAPLDSIELLSEAGKGFLESSSSGSDHSRQEAATIWRESWARPTSITC